MDVRNTWKDLYIIYLILIYSSNGRQNPPKFRRVGGKKINDMVECVKLRFVVCYVALRVMLIHVVSINFQRIFIIYPLNWIKETHSGINMWSFSFHQIITTKFIYYAATQNFHEVYSSTVYLHPYSYVYGLSLDESMQIIANLISFRLCMRKKKVVINFFCSYIHFMKFSHITNFTFQFFNILKIMILRFFVNWERRRKVLKIFLNYWSNKLFLPFFFLHNRINPIMGNWHVDKK